MRDVLAELLTLLRLERVERKIFRGNSQDLGWGRVFGGQVVGQALSAAAQTVADDRPVHSLHGYFLRPGDAHKPVVYEVDPIRDGGTFTTRRVVAIQAGEAIFTLECSFQEMEEGFDHQDAMPDAPDPDTLLSEHQLAALMGDRLPDVLKRVALADRPVEIRPVAPTDPTRPHAAEASRQLWYRASGPLPDDLAVHQYLLAYASDFNFLTTAMMPHGVSWVTPGLQVASLDHAMWFHRPFRFDDWLLYDVRSPSASGSRGLVFGRFFDRKGRLVASLAQEGLMRLHPLG